MVRGESGQPYLVDRRRVKHVMLFVKLCKVGFAYNSQSVCS